MVGVYYLSGDLHGDTALVLLAHLPLAQHRAQLAAGAPWVSRGQGVKVAEDAPSAQASLAEGSC